MKEYYVYAHYKTGEENIPFYIGKGKGRRAWKRQRNNEHWRSVVNKYGYVVHLLAENLSESDALWLEVQLIGMFGRSDIGKGPLVNQTNGGDTTAGLVHTEESKRKISVAGTGRKVSDITRKRQSESSKGKVKSAEHRKNIGLSQLGRRNSPEAIKKTADALRGRKQPEEILAKHRGRKQPKEVVEKRAAKLRGQKRTPEQIERFRLVQLGKKASEETKQKMSRSQILRYERLRNANNVVNIATSNPTPEAFTS